MKKSVLTILLLFSITIMAAVLISGCSQYGGNQGSTQAPAATAPPVPPADQVVAANMIEITAAGFTPNALIIKAGDTVTFVNKDAAQHWPASAVHPTHTLYPEPGGCIGSKFDACKGLATGETFKFTFTNAGSWKYHDHLNPSLFGTIVVQ